MEPRLLLGICKITQKTFTKSPPLLEALKSIFINRILIISYFLRGLEIILYR